MYTQTQVARAIRRHRYESFLSRTAPERRTRGVRRLRLRSRRWEFAPEPSGSSPRRRSALSPG